MPACAMQIPRAGVWPYFQSRTSGKLANTSQHASSETLLAVSVKFKIVLVTHSDGDADATETHTCLERPAQSRRHVGSDRTFKLCHDLGGTHSLSNV